MPKLQYCKELTKCKFPLATGCKKYDCFEPTRSRKPQMIEGPTCETPGYMRKWQLTCKSCKAVEKWWAKSFEDASDKIVTMGWRSDRFMGGMVCPKCRVA